MDIDYLIDRLEILIRNGKRVPLTANKIMVDEQECFNLIDQLRVAIPEEVTIAKRTLLERERILTDADEEAHQITDRATQERQRILDREGLLAEAHRQSKLIINAAAEEAYDLRENGQAIYDDSLNQAQEIREGSNQYTLQVLDELETLLSRHHTMVQNGIKSFQQRAAQYQQEMDLYMEKSRPRYSSVDQERIKEQGPTGSGGRQIGPANSKSVSGSSSQQSPPASNITEKNRIVRPSSGSAPTDSTPGSNPTNRPPSKW